MEENQIIKPETKKGNVLDMLKVVPVILKLLSRHWGSIESAYNNIKPLIKDISDELKKKEEKKEEKKEGQDGSE